MSDRYAADRARFVDANRESRRGPRSRFHGTLAVLLLALLVSAVCALFVDARSWTLAGVLAGVVVLGIAYPWLSLLGLRGELSFVATRGREGEPLTIHLKVTNFWPWPVWGVLVDPGCGTDPADEQAPDLMGMAAILAGRASQWQWEFTPDLRGRYPIRQPSLLSGFPFGLWTARRALPAATPVVVWPRAVTSPVASLPVGSLLDDRAIGRGIGASGDFCGVRPYRRGDSLRRVHWSQTARYDSFIVCERHAPVAPVVQIVVDTEASWPDALGKDGTIAWNVRVAAGLLMRLVADGAVVELVAGQCPPQRVANPAGVPAGLTYLALLLPGEASLTDTLSRSHCGSFRGDQQLVVAAASAAHGMPRQQPSAARRKWLLLEDRPAAAREPLPAAAAAAQCGPVVRICDGGTVSLTPLPSRRNTCHVS